MRKLTMDELNRDSVEQYQEKEKQPIVVVLDNIRSLHNVGSAFRTSDAFVVEKLILCGITGQPPHREIHKTALGATDSVTWQHEPSQQEAILKLKAEGYQIVIIEQTDESVLLHKAVFKEDKKYAFVFGNEAFGVSEDILPLGDMSLEIPQFGTKHSLNISVCIGVVLWQYTSSMTLKE